MVTVNLLANVGDAYTSPAPTLIEPRFEPIGLVVLNERHEGLYSFPCGRDGYIATHG